MMRIIITGKNSEVSPQPFTALGTARHVDKGFPVSSRPANSPRGSYSGTTPGCATRRNRGIPPGRKPYHPTASASGEIAILLAVFCFVVLWIAAGSVLGFTFDGRTG
jgi:hypothetical protein